MIKIICIGKLKENYLKDAEQEYLKRLKKYTQIELIELPDSNIVRKRKESNTKVYKNKRISSNLRNRRKSVIITSIC